MAEKGGDWGRDERGREEGKRGEEEGGGGAARSDLPAPRPGTFLPSSCPLSLLPPLPPLPLPL